MPITKITAKNSASRAKQANDDAFSSLKIFFFFVLMLELHLQIIFGQNSA